VSTLSSWSLDEQDGDGSPKKVRKMRIASPKKVWMGRRGASVVAWSLSAASLGLLVGTVWIGTLRS
jgi:hypothetical protein